MLDKNETRCERCGEPIGRRGGKSRVINVRTYAGRYGDGAHIVEVLMCRKCHRHYERHFSWFFLAVAALIVGLLCLIGAMN